MSFNHTAIPTLVLAGVLFVAGAAAERKTQSPRLARIILLLLGIAAAIPGMFVLADYTHVFRSSAWFYEFRTAPYSEIHRWTWIPGWLSLLAHRARRKGRESDLADSALCSGFDSLYQTHPGSNQCGRSSNHLPRQRLPANHLLDLRSFVRGKHPALARPERVRAEPGS